MRARDGTSPIDSPAARELLDALRGGAALVVFAAHASFYWLDGYDTSIPTVLLRAADLAVIVFFVISGIVIVASMCRRAEASPDGRLDVARFARDRARRLLPPLGVALVVTTLCHAFLIVAGPAGYDSYWDAQLALGVVLFLQGLVAAFDVPLANGPLWSLAHEGWFYVAGVALFVRGQQPLVFATGLLAVALGAATTFGFWPTALEGQRSATWLPGFVVWCAGGALALAANHHRLPSFGHPVPGDPVLARTTARAGAAGLDCPDGLAAVRDAPYAATSIAVPITVLVVVLITAALAEPTVARYAFGLATAALLAVVLPALAATADTSTTAASRSDMAKSASSESAASGAVVLTSLGRALRPLADIAPFSYTLYVLHFPLVLACNVATDGWQQTPLGLFATCALGTAAIVGTCAVVGRRVERLRRDRLPCGKSDRRRDY